MSDESPKRRPEVVALANATGIELDAAERVQRFLDSERPLGFSASIGGEPSEGDTWVTESGPVDERAPADTRRMEPGERYEDQGLLGRGGSGEVRRVFDRQLGRSVAMKILSTDARSDERRFLDEARTIARLQHPCVLPVHEIGRLPDGRVFFTMQEIRGQTLRERIRKVHLAASDHWRATDDGWTFHRLVAAFHATVEAVAYAHGEQIVHRDLKPQNVMIGVHGEVLVVDWGLARATGTPNVPGRVVGTPAYLAPELLREEVPPVHPRADVYALGAILYVLLTNRSPFDGPDPRSVIEAVRAGPSPVPHSDRPLPEPLIEVCVRALARDPAARIGHAGVMAIAIRTWLDGAHKREEALGLVEQARGALPEAAWLRHRAAELETQVRQDLLHIPAHAPEETKHAAWSRLDEANQLRTLADAREDEAELVLQGALTVDPDLPEAHVELAVRAMARHGAAEQANDHLAATRALNRIRRHVDSLPPHHPSRPGLDAWMKGDARLSLSTVPSGATVLAHRLVERHRRTVPELIGSIGQTPLSTVPIPLGDLLLEISHPSGSPCRLPVRVARGAHIQLVAPGETDAFVLPLPSQLAPNERYVPAGWCTVGGDPIAIGSATRRTLWVDGFIMRRDPVTNREFITFLDDLVARGEEELALQLAPRERGGTRAELGALIYGRGADGRFHLREDVHGHLWDEQWPVMMIPWTSAMAYAHWEAERTQLPWRLPSEWEWEKAARGVDERPYPWGWTFDPSRACTRLSHSGEPLPARVGEGFQADESIWGIRGLAGNVRDWCLDRYAEVPPDEGSRVVVDPVTDDGPRVNRGGFWLGNDRDARGADRHFHPPDHRAAEIGFRLTRSWPPETPR